MASPVDATAWDGRSGAVATVVLLNPMLHRVGHELLASKATVIVTPHIAGLSRETNRNLSRSVAEQVPQVLADERPRRVRAAQARSRRPPPAEPWRMRPRW